MSTDSPLSHTNGLLPSLSQYPLYQPPQPSHPQQPPLPQRNPSSNTHYSSPNGNPLQLQTNRYPKSSDSSQQEDEPQKQENDSSINSNTSRHVRYPNTDTPISHPNSSDSQAPPPIPTNKPIQIHPQQINPIPINASQLQSPPSSQQSTEIPSSPQAQPQEQNQSHSPVSSQPQVPINSLPQSQSDEPRPEINENTYMITDEPPPYTPNEAFTGDIAPGEDISIRKITRDDSYDEENPYGFRDVNNDNLDEQEQNNNQSNNNQEQRTQRTFWPRR
jgi:hypothetical protein